MKIKNIAISLLLTLLILPCFGQKAKIDITWDPNPEGDLAGYRIYWGPNSRFPVNSLINYTNVSSIGKTNFFTLTGLPDNATYYIAVTAYNINGLESDYSNEIMVTTSSRPSVPNRITWSQQKDVVFFRGKTNSNQTITPIIDIQLEELNGQPVSLVGLIKVNNTLINTRTVTSSNGLFSFTASKSFSRPFIAGIEANKLTVVPYNPGIIDQKTYQ